MFCCICAKPAVLGYTTVALSKAGDLSSARNVHFCSPACQKRKIEVKCPECERYVFVTDPETDFGNWVSKENANCCLACYAAKTLRRGQTIRSLWEDDHGKNASNLYRWLRPDVLIAAGYQVKQIPGNNWAYFLRVAAAHVILLESPGAFNPAYRPPPAVYVRPNGARARAAVLQLCAAQRLERVSLLTVLPRDLIVLLGKRVLVEKFTPEWLYLKNEETEKDR